MAYEYLAVGTQRFTQNGYIGSTDPNYATKIYSMAVFGTSTSATALVALASGVGSQLTTASAMGTVYLAVAANNTGTGYTWNYWDNHYGILLNGPALYITGTGITFAVVNYQNIAK